MKIAVVGGGAIGGILSSHLLKAGNEVILVDVDQEVLANAKGEGLKIEGPAVEKIQGKFSIKPTDAVNDFANAGAVDTVFVCVKTTIQKLVAESLAKAWRSGATVVSFQNGIDPEEPLAEVAGHDNALRVVVNYAGHVVSPGNYSVNWFTPPNYIGALTENGKAGAAKIAELLNAAKLTTEVVDDIKKRAFEKTALNATLCPICTLTDLTMGEAMALPATRALAVEILKEALSIANKMKWKFDHTLDDWLSYLEKGGPHRTSMWEDMNAGRKTEIGFMNGKICEYGTKVGVLTPYNDTMVKTIMGKESLQGR